MQQIVHSLPLKHKHCILVKTAVLTLIACWHGAVFRSELRTPTNYENYVLNI